MPIWIEIRISLSLSKHATVLKAEISPKKTYTYIGKQNIKFYVETLKACVGLFGSPNRLT